MTLRKKLKNWLSDEDIDVEHFITYLSDRELFLNADTVIAWEEIGEYIEDFKSIQNEYI